MMSTCKIEELLYVVFLATNVTLQLKLGKHLNPCCVVGYFTISHTQLAEIY